MCTVLDKFGLTNEDSLCKTTETAFTTCDSHQISFYRSGIQFPRPCLKFKISEPFRIKSVNASWTHEASEQGIN